MDFLGRRLPDVFRIQLLLVQHWIHVTSVYGGFWVSTAENCGVSAVAVHQGRRLLLHGAEADFHGLAVQQTTVIAQLQFLNEVIDDPVSSHAHCVQRQVPMLHLLLINKVVYTLSSRRG